MRERVLARSPLRQICCIPAKWLIRCIPHRTNTYSSLDMWCREVCVAVACTGVRRSLDKCVGGNISRKIDSSSSARRS